MSGKQSLHSLLERMNDVHRKDIKEINVGHLNENKLLQDKGHEKKKKKKIWNTANQSSLRYNILKQELELCSNRGAQMRHKAIHSLDNNNCININ